MSEIRTVSVHLDADVAGYIAKMRLAGAETDKAFRGASGPVDDLNRSLSTSETELAKVDTSARRVESSVGRLNRTVTTSQGGWTSYTKKVDGFVSKVTTLPAIALGAAAALQPLAAAGLAVGAAFAAPLAFGGGGLTLFAILGGFAVAQTHKQLTQIDQLQKKLQTLKKGTADYAVAEQQLKTAQDALTPGQRAYAAAIDNLHGSFDKFLGGKSGQSLLDPIAQALNLAADLLPRVSPIITAVDHGLSTLLTDLDRFSRTDDFRNFIHDVADQIGPDLIIGGRALGDFTHGVGDLLLTLGKSSTSRQMLRELGHLGQDFSTWSASKQGRDDVRGFLEYFHQVGPDVAHTIGSVAHAVAQISQALAPIGPVELRVISGIADAIAGIPVPVLTALAGATIGLATFQKVGGFKAVGAAPTALRVGQNLLSNVTGGLVPPATAGGGTQKVFVTNWKDGGLGRGGLGGDTALLGEGALASTVSTVAALLAAGAGTVALSALIYKLGEREKAAPASPGYRDYVAGQSPAEARRFNRERLQQQGLLPPPKVIAESSKQVGVLDRQLEQSSRAMELFGHSANRAFNGDATKGAENATAKLQKLNGVHAEQAFDLIGHSAARNTATAGQDVDILTGKINRIPDKNVHVHVDTSGSSAILSHLQYQVDQLHGKTMIVRTVGGHTVTGQADGGTVAGQRHPYGDKVLTALAPGEFVVSNRRGQADRYRPYLQRINAMADGGTVPSVPFSTDASGSLAIGGVRGELRALQQSLRLTTNELDAERQRRQALIAQRQQYASTVRDGFRTDIFGSTTGSPWAPASASNPLAILRGNIRDARRYDRIIKRLGRRGVTGGLAGEITTLASAQQVAAMSPAELRQLEHLYAERQRVTGQAGRDDGNLAVGSKIDATNALIAGLRGDVHRLTSQVHHLEAEQRKNAHHTGKAVGDSINDTAGKATRRVRKP